ncbi:unnamed protein product [Rotaria sp. Silwood1]|nr:unnamed protein product [Rotaria sp. Silwood1]CAF0982174.1 unnamed protein product [Rotaria sp. Silwood1]CAF1070158.1 unnamed protein product [Rotaria sp. Silwood1]CAF3410377.1 unnamed protein product [Rotaria sp. Silwood1]CAF3410644.1 unnamed protein product [Rotaria sp. Silwood1]
MSTMRLLLLVIFLINRSNSIDDLIFQIQPQSVRINNFDELYITNDNHFIGQILYRYDEIQLACECQTQINHIKYNIYWTINNKTYNQYNNSNSIELLINLNTVQAPITYVTCHCIFIQSNRTKIRRYYQYQLYIDLESEPSLQSINYSLELNIIKERFYNFIHHRYLIILSFILIIIGISCPLMILNSGSFL